MLMYDWYGEIGLRADLKPSMQRLKLRKAIKHVARAVVADSLSGKTFSKVSSWIMAVIWTLTGTAFQVEDRQLRNYKALAR